MAAENPDNNSDEPLGFNFSEFINMDPSKLIMGPVGHGKHNLLGFFLTKGMAGRTPAPIEPLSPQETSLARNDLGMSEQHVENLSRFSGKRWLNAMGVEYPKEWE